MSSTRRSCYPPGETAPGLKGFFTTVDHKDIGIRYIVTAFIFLGLGGIEALIMRLQLAGPNLTLLTPDQYNQLFSTHGMTMIFLYASPVLSGFSNYLWPLLLGSRDMAFPRLNAFSYWIYVAAGIFLYAGFLTGNGPNDGWFNYVPYASRAYNPGLNEDFYALGMVFLGISTTVGAANFIVTAMRTRAPGNVHQQAADHDMGGRSRQMRPTSSSCRRSGLAFFLLWMDRQFGTRFFDPVGGWAAFVVAALFWIFGHPWVYAIVLPAMGMVSDGLPVFCRRPARGVFGRRPVDRGNDDSRLRGVGSSHVRHRVAQPRAVFFLRRLHCDHRAVGRRRLRVGCHHLAGATRHYHGLPVFFFHDSVCSSSVGCPGFMTASGAGGLAIDGYVLRGGASSLRSHRDQRVSGLGAAYFWFPKMTGRLLDERLGRWNFWTMFIGFNLAFLPMHVTGLLGMPRRVYTYADGMGWDTLNLVTSIGSFVLAVGVLLFVANVVKSLKSGASAGANPWDAPTLEWSVPSPPPPYNFTVIPTVASRHPLWEDRLGEEGAVSSLSQGMLLDSGRETIGTTALDAAPDMIMEMPEDSFAPVLMAAGIAILFVGLLLKAWTVVGVGGFIAALALLLWLWPRRDLRERGGHAMTEIALAKPEKLPVGPIGRHGIGYWGVATLVASESALFIYLLFSYYYTGRGGPVWLVARVRTLFETGAAEYWAAAGFESRCLVR